MELINWITANWAGIANAIAAVIGAASVVVQLTPTLKDDNFLLPIVKFLGKYIALNKSVSDADRPK
jgi:hypothetical protein